MKSKASSFLKHIISVSCSIVKSKTVGIKAKVNAAKARLIMLSLMKNKKVLADSVSHKIHRLLGQHDRGEQSKAIILYSNAMGPDYEFDNFQNNEGDEEFGNGGDNADHDDDDDDDDKYPDLRHSLFKEEEEELDLDESGGGSIIDQMRNAMEEDGLKFNLEDEIDHVADMFITKFHKQIRIQKLQSFKRFQEMLARGL